MHTGPEMMACKTIYLFIILFYILFNNPCYSETDTLHQGQQLKDWDELISSNRVFSLKFFSFGSMVSPYLGIFYNIYGNRYVQSDYNQRKESEDFSYTAVWVANRNNPIKDIYGNLVIDSTGKLSILSGGGTVIDLFTPSQRVARNASVTLLDSGNLVLQQLHPDGSVKQVLWQSFDYPTDTLLPGMKLGINLKTGHRWSLTAWRNDELPAEGSFKLVLDFNGTGQMVILRQGNVHWTSGLWQHDEFKNTDLQSSGPDVRLYYVSNETEQSFTFLTRTYNSFPALRMYQDGWLKGSPLKLNLHCHSVDDPPGCAEEEFDKLECRKGYKIGSQRVNYYYHTYVNEHIYDESYNLYDCQRICWSDCSCVAYATRRNRVGCKTYGKVIFGEFGPKTEHYTFGFKSRNSKLLKLTSHMKIYLKQVLIDFENRKIAGSLCVIHFQLKAILVCLKPRHKASYLYCENAHLKQQKIQVLLETVYSIS